MAFEMAFTVFRLAFSDPLQFYEQMGDPVTTQGGAPIPAIRTALRHSVTASTFMASGPPETVAGRLKLRRQFRSLANNTPMKLTGFYLGWDADPEQNGWYLPDQGQLVDIDGSVGLATGVFKVENFVWIVAGRPRTHRRAMWVYLKDLRTGRWARDFRRVIYSTDYSGLSALAVSFLPASVTDLIATGSGTVSSAVALPSGSDGFACNLATNLIDLARISYEQVEAAINKGQVVAYDRRGEQTGPTGGPGTAWEEFYGPDYPYSWLGPAAEPIDAPVLENGRCRVRYDATNLDGWRIDVWTGSQWEEQGKVTIERRGESNLPDTELLSASLVEYSETRAVVQCVMKTPSDASSREEVFITLQRGWSGPRFEVYAGLTSSGAKADAAITLSLAVADSDDSAMSINVATALDVATAKGTGHTGLWSSESGGTLGENLILLGRWGKSFGACLVPVQSGLTATLSSNSEAYGAARNVAVLIGSGKKGYLSAHLGFPPQKAQQALEAEGMTLGAGTTSTVDAAASGGKAATATRTTDANAHVTQATWPNSYVGIYRVFARVKTSASTLNIYAKTGFTTGATKTTASTEYVWVDLGSVVSTGTLEIHCWATAAATVSVDRVEAFLVEDRQAGGIYQGARDLAQSCLIDSRTIPTLVARSG